MYIIYRKFKFFSIKTGFILMDWYLNYHISLMAITTREIFIFTPQDENKSCTYRKKVNILYILKQKQKVCNNVL